MTEVVFNHMSNASSSKPDSDPTAETMLLIEQLRIERERLQREIDRIVQQLQIQIDRASITTGNADADRAE